MRSALDHWRSVRRPAPSKPTAGKQTVLCVGCVEDCALLDRVLGPGEYAITFLESSEGAYTRILSSMPTKVIFCMRADDERSLQVLSMLNLDPRTNRIPIITCIPRLTPEGGGVEPPDAGDAVSARPWVVMH
jgi:hypothetical protein